MEPRRSSKDQSKKATFSGDPSAIDATFDPDHIPDDHRPERGTEDSSGIDLRADIATAETLHPGTSSLIPSGLQIALPSNLEAQVRPRSGLAYKHGITVLNSPGTIDSDYRGDIGVILINHSDFPHPIRPGERIAQLVIQPVVKADLDYGDSLDDTERGEGGFGSTGRE